jgi:cobalamin biosynthesis Mg chelatase CobN
LLEAVARGMWDGSQESLEVLRSAVLEAEGWEEAR